MSSLRMWPNSGGEVFRYTVGFELLFTFNVSPDLTPIVECFSKIRLLVNEDLVGRSEHHNLKVSVMNAIKNMKTRHVRLLIVRLFSRVNASSRLQKYSMEQ